MSAKSEFIAPVKHQVLTPASSQKKLANRANSINITTSVSSSNNNPSDGEPTEIPKRREREEAIPKELTEEKKDVAVIEIDSDDSEENSEKPPPAKRVKEHGFIGNKRLTLILDNSSFNCDDDGNDDLTVATTTTNTTAFSGNKDGRNSDSKTSYKSVSTSDGGDSVEEIDDDTDEDEPLSSSSQTQRVVSEPVKTFQRPLSPYQFGRSTTKSFSGGVKRTSITAGVVATRSSSGGNSNGSNRSKSDLLNRINEFLFAPVKK